MFKRILTFGLTTKILNTRTFTTTYIRRSGCEYLERKNGNKIAFHRLQSDNHDAVGVVFLSGFQSNMQGIKAIAMERYCSSNNLPFIRFDYQGCGESTGDLRQMSLSDWRTDAMAVLDELTAGPQILVGSSMGGLHMLHLAEARPTRVKALVGIATAADMPERMFRNYSEGKILREIEEKGESLYTTDTHQYIITKHMIEDMVKHSILTRDTIPIHCPVRLLHGMKDTSVPFQVSLDVAQKLQSLSVNIHLRKSGDHRFSQPDDIELMFEIMDCLVYGTGEVRDLAIKSFEAFARYSKVKTSPDVLNRAISSRLK